MAANKKHSTLSGDEAWESGALGRDEAHVAPATDDIESAIDEALELHPISIRLQKSLIEDFKLIAQFHGVGYQPLMRQILARFAECEKKQIIKMVLAERDAAKTADSPKDAA